MAVKKGPPLWLAVTLFLLLAALLAIAMILEMSDARTTMTSSQTLPRTHAVPRHAITVPKRAPVTAHKQVPEAVPETAEPPMPAAGISLILDDVGYDLPALRRILRLDVPVAIAVIPDAPYARQAAIIAHRAEQMVMLHLPMQPESEKYSLNMSDAFLQADMNEPQLRSTFLKDLALVPYVEGINNHMGSALTQMEQPMHWVMQLCLEKGLFFVDSKTSAKSVAGRIAREMGLERANRRFFLDHDLDIEALKSAWEKARVCARKGHRCIIIGHPHPETVTFLENYLSADDRAMMVPLKGLLFPASLQQPTLARSSIAVAQP